jgi:hypothetical protein
MSFPTVAKLGVGRRSSEGMFFTKYFLHYLVQPNNGMQIRAEKSLTNCQVEVTEKG